MALDDGSFEPTFAVEIDPEFPGDGNWRCPVVGFDRDGSVMETFDSRWGTPFVVRVTPVDGDEWVGMFAAGGLGSFRGACATPLPSSLAVAVDGLAYLVDVNRPAAGARILQDQLHQLVPMAEPPLLLLVRFIDIVAIGADGIAWATPRLCVDDLQVVRADPDGIVCSCDNLGGSPTLTLDPRTGEQIAGTRLDSFWPPDALG